MLRSGSSPLSVGALVSMPGRWAGAPARLRTKRNESAPDPPIGRPEDFWTGYLDSKWTLDQISKYFQGSESVDSEPEIRSGGRI